MNYMLHFVSFQQRTVSNYFALEKAQPFPKPTPLSKRKTVANNYLAKEKTEPFPEPTPFSKQKTVTNYFAKEKTEPFPTTQASFRNTGTTIT